MRARLSPHGNIFIDRHGKTFCIERLEAEELLYDLHSIIDTLKGIEKKSPESKMEQLAEIANEVRSWPPYLRTASSTANRLKQKIKRTA